MGTHAMHTFEYACVCVHLCVCERYLMDGFEEGPVQVCECSCYVPGVNTQESHRPPAQLSAVRQRRLNTQRREREVYYYVEGEHIQREEHSGYTVCRKDMSEVPEKVLGVCD